MRSTGAPTATCAWCRAHEAAPGVAVMTTDWRESLVSTIRSLVLEADAGVTEEAKWRKASNPDGVPTFSVDGLICTVETYKDKVKVTFAKGASLDDPAGLFNASLEGGTRRAIDIREGDAIDEAALQALVRAAVALNTSAQAARRKGPSRIGSAP